MEIRLAECQTHTARAVWVWNTVVTTSHTIVEAIVLLVLVALIAIAFIAMAIVAVLRSVTAALAPQSPILRVVMQGREALRARI